MPEFDPEALDDADRIATTDRTDLLRGLASAGALVRRAGSLLSGDVGRIELDSPPRATLIAVEAGYGAVVSGLRALGSDAGPVIGARPPRLPRWAGPADALVAISVEGRDPLLADLVADAERRGLSVFVAAPAGSPVHSAARIPAADLDRLRGAHPRAVWWAVLALGIHASALFALGDRRGDLDALADAVDEVAAVNRPDSSAYTAPAKVLASELADGSVVVAGAGELAYVAAGKIAESLRLLAGVAAVGVSLPEAAAEFGGLVAGSSVQTDIFADPVDASSAPPRLLVIGDDYPLESGPAQHAFGDEIDRRAAEAVLRTALDAGIRRSRIETPPADPLVRCGVAIATGDFAAAYLGLARGIDPGAVRPGEYGAS